MIVLTVIVITLMLKTASCQSPPPNYNYRNLPETRFTCEDKATGGYYADPEAGCQMFHVCLRVSEDEINDFKFLCPNNTIFDQQSLICTNWWEIDCARSTQYYSKNDLFKVDEPTTTTQAAPEYVDNTNLNEYEETIEYVDNQTTPAPKPISHRFTLSQQDNSNTYNTSNSVRITTRKKVEISEKRSFSTTPAPTTVFQEIHRFEHKSENIGKPAFQNDQDGQRTSVNRNRSRKRINKPKSIFENINDQEGASSQTPESTTKLTTTTPITTDVPESETVTATPRRRKFSRRRQSKKQAMPEEKHKEFSNFRFYKTAFGRSYSSDDYITTKAPPRRRRRFRRPNKRRRGRTISARSPTKRTRFAKYGR